MPKEAENKSRIKVLLTIVLYSIIVIVISGIIYVILEQNGSESTSEGELITELHYIAKTENGSYLFAILTQDNSQNSLNMVKISVFKKGNETNETVYKDILLSGAKMNPQNASSDDKILYHDLDNDDIVSTGDLIFIWIAPSMPGDYTVEMKSVSDELLGEGTFTAY